MRRHLRRGAWVAAATAVLVFLLALKPLPPIRSVAIWVMLLAAIALRELVRSLDLSHEPKSGFERALASRGAPAPAPSLLERMERELDLAVASADYAHRRLLPLLRSAAAARLAKRHGTDLERRPDAARELLDARTWEFLRPDRPEPANRHAPGPRRSEIAAVVAQVEAL